MAGPCAQHRIDAGPEGIQQVEGDKGLDRSGEAAAVDPVGPPALHHSIIMMIFCVSALE